MALKKKKEREMLAEFKRKAEGGGLGGGKGREKDTSMGEEGVHFLRTGLVEGHHLTGISGEDRGENARSLSEGGGGKREEYNTEEEKEAQPPTNTQREL